MNMKTWGTMLVVGAAAVAAAAAEKADPAAAFRSLCGQKAAEGDSMAVAGSDGWLFLRSELRHVGAGAFWGPAAAAVSRSTSPDKADPLPAIVDFVEQMKSRGVEVLVVPVPCKAFIEPERLGGPAGKGLDGVHREFYGKLGDKGVTVIDLAEKFAAEKAAGKGLYCKTDSHWSPYACELTARLLVERIGGAGAVKARPQAITTRAESRPIAGDLAEAKVGETLPARVVETKDGTPLENPESPVVLMGDSHCLVFHAGGDLQGTGAGLADQLAAELGAAVDVIGVRGAGATPARVNLLRRTKANPAYLANKKWIVWCFAAREFTESPGWSTVPFGSVTAGKE